MAARYLPGMEYGSPVARHVVGLVGMVLVAAGCGGAGPQVRGAVARGDTPAALRLYHQYVDERGEGNPDLLADVALGILRDTAASGDARARSAGFSALRSTGVRGRDTLETLSRRPGVVGDRAAAALFDLEGRSGAPPPRLAVALASPDPERRIAGMASLGAQSAGVLITLLLDPAPAIRTAAAQRLARLRGAPVATALTAAARGDTDAGVRAAAVMALGAQGPDAATAVVAALNDPDTIVRLAAPSALMASSPEDAAEALAPLLSGEPTDLSLESARVLASHADPRAAAYVIAALGSPRPEIRAQAAVAANALPEAHSAALAGHLGDPDPEVVMRLAAILVRRGAYRDRALAALRPLAARPDGFLAIRALAALAAAGDASATEPIREALSAGDTTVRRLAVLAWPDIANASGNTDPLVPLLTDPDRSVALMAAVEIVLIASR